MLGHQTGHEHGSQGMLEPGMIGPGIDSLHQAQLLYALQSLHRSGADEKPLQLIHLDGPMDGVAKSPNLVIHKITWQSLLWSQRHYRCCQVSFGLYQGRLRSFRLCTCLGDHQINVGVQNL